MNHLWPDFWLRISMIVPPCLVIVFCIILLCIKKKILKKTPPKRKISICAAVLGGLTIALVFSSPFLIFLIDYIFNLNPVTLITIGIITILMGLGIYVLCTRKKITPKRPNIMIFIGILHILVALCSIIAGCGFSILALGKAMLWKTIVVLSFCVPTLVAAIYWSYFSIYDKMLTKFLK